MSQRPFPFRTYLSYARRYFHGAREMRRHERVNPILPAPHRPEPAAWPDDRLTLAWLGHATVLMNLYGTRAVTDPALRARIGISVPGATFGPRRLVAPALAPDELPPVDVVLLSHAHMDHTDLGTLRRLPRSAHAVVARGNGDLARRFRRVDELAWDESARVHDGRLRVTGTPVRHWGARVIRDTHRGFGGFLLETRGRAVLFAGDTADTHRLLPTGWDRPVDVAIVPIGAYDPWIANHATPEQAWRMANEAGARWIVPVHHGTFRLSREPMDEPLRRLLAAAGRERDRVVITRIGETWTLPED